MQNNSKFDHTKVPDSEVFYNLKYLNTFTCSALYRTLRSAHTNASKQLFQKLEACVLSGMSERARACFSRMQGNIQSTEVSPHDAQVLEDCFSRPEIQQERTAVQVKSKSFPNLGRYLSLVHELQDPLVENRVDVPLKRCERSVEICKPEQDALTQCMKTREPWQCYKENVNMYLCFHTANCYKSIALCRERLTTATRNKLNKLNNSKANSSSSSGNDNFAEKQQLAAAKQLSPEDQLVFCLDNNRTVLQCYSRARELLQQVQLLKNLPDYLERAQRDSFDALAAETNTAAMVQQFKKLHFTSCKGEVEQFKTCLKEQDEGKVASCYEGEVKVNFCLLTSLWYVELLY